jgi:hypothetical protein
MCRRPFWVHLLLFIVMKLKNMDGGNKTKKRSWKRKKVTHVPSDRQTESTDTIAEVTSAPQQICDLDVFFATKNIPIVAGGWGKPLQSCQSDCRCIFMHT